MITSERSQGVFKPPTDNAALATLRFDATQRPVSGPTAGPQLALGACAYSGVTVRHR
jgi:hypothetical protein